MEIPGAQSGSKPASAGASGSGAWPVRLEWGVCVGATLVAVGLHGLRLFHAGGLWRDEAGGVGMGTLPTLGEMWAMLPRDSFPLVFPLVLRFWVGVGLGSTDLGLRVVGLLVGLGLLATLWWVAWILGRRRPLVSLGLLAVNATVVQWGDSLRAYGLGALLMLLTLGWVWQMVQQPSLGRWAAASGCALLSVQCLYQNAFLLAAVCRSAAVVCVRQQRLRTAG